MAATIKDVAQLAGVSTTTVSHVINGTRFVSDELRQRVYQAMEALNYQPNILARGLRRGDTRTIGLIVPDNSNPFFAELLRAIEDAGFQEGYNVILCNSDGDVDKEAAYIHLLFAKQVDGIIFIAVNNSPGHLSGLLQPDVPVVIVDRDLPLKDTDVILVDNEKGGFDATNYLISLGHHRIACIAGPSGVTPSAERVRGYLRALQEAGICQRDEFIVHGDFRFKSGEQAAHQLLSLPDPPTAIFACNDLMAIGAMRALRQCGVTIPEDVSVIGFDDIQLASAVTPSLTTVAQPIAHIGRVAVHHLVARIRSESVCTPKRIVLETQLIVRESCAPV